MSEKDEDAAWETRHMLIRASKKECAKSCITLKNLSAASLGLHRLAEMELRVRKEAGYIGVGLVWQDD